MKRRSCDSPACHHGSAADRPRRSGGRASGRRSRHQPDRTARSARGPLGDHQYGPAHHARLAVDARDRRRARHHAVRAARPRQDAGNDFAARLGRQRPHHDVRRRRQARPDARSTRRSAGCSRARRSPRRATARTSCSRASCRASTSSTAHRRSPSATSRSRRTSSTCCGSRTDPATNQVMLRVRFAEVSRSAMQELGGVVLHRHQRQGRLDWPHRRRSSIRRRSSTATRVWSSATFSISSSSTPRNSFGAVIKALKGKGLFQSLAEPNLITQDGQEASFLAGGEYPYPVVQGSGINSAVTIVFKEFGVRLRFTPTITADGMIQLKVAPEVSTLDFGNAVVVSGFRVPALSTRRTETQVELRDGQTFAIAGHDRSAT